MKRYSLALRWMVALFYAMVSIDALAQNANVIGQRPCFKVAQLGKDAEISLQPSPLIGGPSWLPVHVKVVLRENSQDCAWDFVPLDATDKGVLTKLTTLQSVPGIIRARASVDANKWGPLAKQGQMFCESYPRELNLIKNNCWTFAIRLTLYLWNAHGKGNDEESCEMPT